MEQREKLIELIAEQMGTRCGNCIEYYCSDDFFTKCFADFLLENGVVVLPCRCGECKHWGKHDDVDVAGETDKIKACEYAIWMVGENGYCVYGERKDGDE